MPLTEQEKQLARILTDPVLWAEATLMSPEQGKSSEYIKLRDCQVEILKDKSLRKCTRMGRRLGKCIPFDANVITATGRMKAFELCSSDNRPPIVTYDEETSRIVSTRNYHIWNNGVKPVYKIETNLGRAAEATGNHPFLVMNNNKTEWKELDTLIIGDLIAVPSTYENVIEGIDIDDILPGLIQDLIDNESCPREIFQGTKENIRKVINAYWKHNGWINIRNGPDIGVLASTFSLARDIQHLLLRIGINAKIEKRESEKDSYTVYIYDTLDIASFLDVEESSQKKSSDILWDRITSIKYVGEKETYDISVPETHTLISDDIVSHNTTTMVIHILWYGFTRKDSKQVIAAPYDSQIRMIFDMLRQFIDNSPELRNSIASSTRNPHEIKLKNGASIKGFTAGTRSGAEGGSLRGQAADWLYMDELDYMTDGDFEAIYAIALADPKKIGVWVSSTPTGRRGMFYKMCMGIMPGWKEFYYPSMANPTWNEDMEKELRATFSGMGYVHEVLAEFGEETVGVFKKEYLDRAKATYQYSQEGNISNPTVLGVDWDKYGAATQMVVLEYNTIYEKFRVVAREEVEKSKFTLDNGVKKIIELNQRYNLDAIYVDRGYGEQRRCKEMNPDWYNEAERLYKNGATYKFIANTLGVNRKHVSYFLRKNGYKSDERYVRSINRNKLAKYRLNENIFETIDTEEKAYWLGFLYADGCVSEKTNSIELGLKEEDLGHLKKFQSFLETDKPIYIKIKRCDDKEYVGYRLIVTSEKIKKSLIRLGCVPNKTYGLKFPSENQVPIDLICHFIRGYFDGDGCITTTNRGTNVSVELLGTESILLGYMKWTGLHQNKISGFKHSDIRRVSYSGKYAMEILEKMYGSASIYLDRKYSLYHSNAVRYSNMSIINEGNR